MAFAIPNGATAICCIDRVGAFGCQIIKMKQLNIFDEHVAAEVHWGWRKPLPYLEPLMCGLHVV